MYRTSVSFSTLFIKFGTIFLFQKHFQFSWLSCFFNYDYMSEEGYPFFIIILLKVPSFYTFVCLEQHRATVFEGPFCNSLQFLAICLSTLCILSFSPVLIGPNSVSHSKGLRTICPSILKFYKILSWHVSVLRRKYPEM